MNTSGSPSPDTHSGLLGGVRNLARNALALVLNRVELAAVELGELRATMLRVLAIGAIAFVLLCFALALWTGLIIALAWDSWGWKILLLLAALFSIAAAALLAQARKLLEKAGQGLPATMAELRADRDALL